MVRKAAPTLLALLLASRAWAIEITSCEQFVPSGETAVLAADLACSRVPGSIFSARGVALDGGATLQLAGHSITGDGMGVGVDCSPQGRQQRKMPCRVVGPGTISGFELGVGGVGIVEVESVTARANRFGFVAAKCCELRVTDVVAENNDVGLQSVSIVGSGIRANDNRHAGVSGGRLRLTHVTATGNGAGGGVSGRGRVRNSTVTGNAGFDGTYDLVATPRIRTRNSTCGRGVRLRTIFGPGGDERTKVLGSFGCR